MSQNPWENPPNADYWYVVPNWNIDSLTMRRG